MWNIAQLVELPSYINAFLYGYEDIIRTLRILSYQIYV